MRRPTVTSNVSRQIVTAVAACLVFIACTPETGTTDETTSVVTEVESGGEAAVGEDANPSTSATTDPTTETTPPSEPEEPTTTTSSTTTTTAAVPDLDTELSEFEDLEALLDELDDLLADL